MAYDGNGVFNRLFNWEADAAAGINILAERFDAEMNGMAVGLSTALTRDGQAGMLANLDMGGFRITGVGAAAADNDAISRAAGDARYLRLAGGTPVTSIIAFQFGVGNGIQWGPDSNTRRWHLFQNQANGNLEFNRFGPDGVFQSTPLLLGSDGRIEIGGQANFMLGSQNGLQWGQTTGDRRWHIFRDPANNNLQFNRFAANGTFQSTPINLAGDGSIVLTGSITLNGLLQSNWGNILVAGAGASHIDSRSGDNTETGFRALWSNNQPRLRLVTNTSADGFWDIWEWPGGVLRNQIALRPGGASLSSGTFQNASDRRIKTEIGEIAGGLDLVMKLRPIRYVAKQAEGFQKIALTGKVLLGMMADELQEVVPEVVYGEPNDPDQLQSVNYTGLVPVLIAAVQELTGRLSKLEQGVH